MVTFPDMSVESFPNQVSENYSDYGPEDGLDIKHDPKGPALQTIHDFLELTPGIILKEPVQNSPNPTDTVSLRGDRRRELHPNQKLARRMLGLEQAINTLRQTEPPLENGEELRSEWSHIDGGTGELTTLEFFCEKMDSGLGTYLSCRINPDDDEDPVDGSYWKLYLPEDSYLEDTFHHGMPQDLVFCASERDIYSPAWSDIREEWLENGGLVRRRYNREKESSTVNGIEPLDVFEPDTVIYMPLYDWDGAKGIERYVEITQKLLKMFLQSVKERDS